MLARQRTPVQRVGDKDLRRVLNFSEGQRFHIVVPPVEDNSGRRGSDLAAGQQTLRATLWIAKSDHRLARFRIPFRTPNAQTDTVLTGDLSNFNLSFDVQRPA